MTSPTLTFDPDTHRYYLGGQLIPGVSSVLKLAQLDARYRDPYEFATTETGTLVHKVLEDWDTGILLRDEICIPDGTEPYLAAWRTFREAWGFTPVFIEERVWNTIHRYAGTVDRIGTLGDEQWAVVDIKTGDPAPWHGLQLAAYLMAAQDRGMFPVGIPVPRRIGVYLRANGTYAVEEYEDGRDGITFKAFLMAYNWRAANA